MTSKMKEVAKSTAPVLTDQVPYEVHDLPYSIFMHAASEQKYGQYDLEATQTT